MLALAIWSLRHLTNLSSTSLCDVVPITAHARSVVMIEQLAGLGDVALFVSRLVGAPLSRRLTHSARTNEEQGSGQGI